jgi:hypothetical protein
MFSARAALTRGASLLRAKSLEQDRADRAAAR